MNLIRKKTLEISQIHKWIYSCETVAYFELHCITDTHNNAIKNKNNHNNNNTTMI